LLWLFHLLNRILNWFGEGCFLRLCRFRPSCWLVGFLSLFGCLASSSLSPLLRHRQTFCFRRPFHLHLNPQRFKIGLDFGFVWDHGRRIEHCVGLVLGLLFLNARFASGGSLLWASPGRSRCFFDRNVLGIALVSFEVGFKLTVDFIIVRESGTQ
jgi:hypothetical protein